MFVIVTEAGSCFKAGWTLCIQLIDVFWMKYADLWSMMALLLQEALGVALSYITVLINMVRFQGLWRCCKNEVMDTLRLEVFPCNLKSTEKCTTGATSPGC
jgi:hypothetical protein